MPEDRQGLRTDVNVPHQSDRHAAGTAYGPPPDGYVKVSGFNATAAVATKTVTMTITPGTNAPVVAGATVQYITDWGDGTAQTVGTATNPAHTYAAAGPQTITVTKQVISDGKVIGSVSKVVAATTV